MSLQASRPPSSGVPDFGSTKPKRSLIPYIAAAVVVAVVATLAILAGSGRIQLPFVGKPTVSQVDATYHWSLTFPRAWAAKKAPVSVDTIRYVSTGDGVGVRVQAQFLKQEVSAAETKASDMVAELNKLEGPQQNRPDSTIKAGPTFGSVNGVPYVHYLLTYTDFSSGTAVLLEDSDYYLFNGANLEIVTFETNASQFSKESGAFTKAIATFHSKHLVEGTPAPAGSVTATATP